MNFTLSNHYRSTNEQLIKFSSHYFYDDNLICITKNGRFKKSIDVFDEMGEYDRENSINTKEANRVIQCLLTTLDIYKSAIVITFNAKQADYIQRLAQSRPELRPHIEDLSIKVRSLENVQGDEGDVVIISCTFGKDKNGRFLQNFGPVNQDGGKNRINVMVTRAKEKMIVIKSFMSSDITNDKNENTFVFKSFIQYTEQIENNTSDSINNVKANDTVVSKDTTAVIDQLASELAFDNTLVIEKHKKIGSHIIDLAISKINSPSVSLCILIDGKYQNDTYSNDIKK
jgi:superfamily I DNA and/or RNA helicase